MIYLDNHATTTCASSVLEVMLPYFSINYGNPASNHSFGQEASLAIANARQQVADLIGADSEEILFTSGATESNNLTILGLARQFNASSGKKKKIVTTTIEHKAVLSPLKYLQSEGWNIEYLDLDSEGCVDLEAAKRIISEDVFLLTIQSANSEIGTLQPIKDLASLASKKGVLFHCDAAQSIGKVPINLDDLDIHFLSFSSHKMYGPKGIGALYIKGGAVSKSLVPLMFGGGTSNLRPGTLPVPLIVGFGVACQLCRNNMYKEMLAIQQLRDEFEHLLIKNIGGISINGCLENRLPNNSSITFPDIDAEMLLANTPDIIASTGAACETGSIEPSRILKLIGLTDEQAYGTIRFGLGRYTQREEIMKAVEYIVTSYNRLLLY